MSNPKSIQEQIEKIRESWVEPVCKLCFPFVCAYWDLPPKERLIKCEPLRDTISEMQTNATELGAVLLDKGKTLPKNPVKITTEFGLSAEEATTRQLELDMHTVVIQGIMLGEGFRKVSCGLDGTPIKEG